MSQHTTPLVWLGKLATSEVVILLTLSLSEEMSWAGRQKECRLPLNQRKWVKDTHSYTLSLMLCQAASSPVVMGTEKEGQWAIAYRNQNSAHP